MREREMVGRLVTLVNPLENRGGTKFPEGMTMRISGMWRGRANLIALTPRPDGTYSAIRGISKSSFDFAEGAPSPIQAIPASPKPKKPSRRQLLKVIERIQTLAGQAKSGYQNDRAEERWRCVVEPLDEIFNLCVKAREMDPP